MNDKSHKKGEYKMEKNIGLVFFISILLVLESSSIHAENNSFWNDKYDSEQRLFTAYNIWIWPRHNIKCINYKGGKIKIHTGTEVKDVKIYEKYNYNTAEMDELKISFKIADSGKRYKIRFISRYHPGKTINDYMKNMFTTKNFDEFTAGMHSSEKDAIKKGIIVYGMSKEAVLASYGPPPEHVTSSLENNEWKYWINVRETELVHFNKNGRTYNPKFQTEYTLEDKLIQLKSLLDKEIITGEEYNNKKADLLKKF